MSVEGTQRYIVADQALYKTFVGADINESALEAIERQSGPVIAVPKIYDPIRKWISSGVCGTPQIEAVWKLRVFNDGQRYRTAISAYQAGNADVELSQYEERYSRAIHLLNGAAAPDDCAIVAFAAWVSERLGVGAVVVTDDSDLLSAGHLLASYLGASFGVKSVFDVLKECNMDSAMTKYCRYTSVADDFWYRPGGEVTSETFQAYLTQLARKAKLAMHPNVRRDVQISSLL
jgi:hypothetical protein